MSDRGRLKVYLGYAAGVGKTFQMLDEAQDLRRKGADIVIGYFEPHGRRDTIARAGDLETVPRRTLEYRGGDFEEMDPDAILHRHPAICLVDELPHTNVPGAGREKRWQDVIVLLEAGIDVSTTMNIQHLESLNDQIFQIAGVQVRETVPDWLVRSAVEVVMVDLTPRALLNRLLRGAVYPADKTQRALQHFFKESTLAALRELALRETAHEVNVRYVDMSGRLPAETEGGGRVLVYVTAEEASMAVIRRARRMADYLGAECFAACVTTAPEEAPERALNFARSLHIETRALEGADPAAALVEFIGVHKITHLFLARPHYGRLRLLAGRNLIHRIIHSARDIEIIVVAGRHPPSSAKA
jgi:two-component system sensor histidine kinase KdpD